jgi:DSHCT (NUC185) domain
MNTCDELTATEMLFYNVLEPLNPPEAAAILSALVFQVRVFVCVFVCVWGGGGVLLLYYCADGYDIISFISSY